MIKLFIIATYIYTGLLFQRSTTRDRSLKEINDSTPKTTQRTEDLLTSRMQSGRRSSSMANHTESDLKMRMMKRNFAASSLIGTNDNTFRESFTKSRNIGSALSMKSVPNKDRSESDMSVVHRLKGALRDVKEQQLRRSLKKGEGLTRPSTAVTSISSISSIMRRPQTRAQAQTGRSFEFNNLGRLDSYPLQGGNLDTLRRSQSTQSLDTLVTQSDISNASFVNNYKDKR